MIDGTYGEYADWYVWAKRNLATDDAVCHGAAEAALAAAESGGDRIAAITAARASLTAAGHLESPSDARRRAYAEWFDWARREFGGTRDQQAAAARAALEVLDSGGSANWATEAARRAHTPQTAPATPERAYPSPPPTMPPPAHRPARPDPAAPASHAQALAAGTGSRLLGWAVDLLVLGLAWVAVSFVVGIVLGLGFAARGADPNVWLRSPSNQAGLGGVVFAILLVVAWIYGTATEASSLGGTFGRVVAGTRLVDGAGARVGFRAASGRWLLKLLTFGAGGLLIPFTEHHQALWDIAAGTRVVRR